MLQRTGMSTLPVPTIPTSQRAIAQDAQGKPFIADGIPIPDIHQGTILVKTIATALNPSDFKMGSAFPTPGAIVGMDFAGTVVCIPKGTETDLAVGDTVCAAVHGSNPAEPGNGAFAEYVRVRADMVFRVPDSLDPVMASTLPTALATCIMTLWSAGSLALDSDPVKTRSSSSPPTPVLVYGGSTATGTIAIQLLKLSGYDPIATCSPHNFDLVRSRGASAVFDYTLPDVAAAIKSHTGGRLKYVLDCISNQQSVSICYQAIQRVGGRYVSLELIPPETLQAQRRRTIKSFFIMAMEIYGEEVKLSRGYERPARPENRSLVTQFFPIFQRMLEEGNIVPHPTEVMQGGLDSVLTGLDLLKSGSLSGKKLVATAGQALR